VSSLDDILSVPLSVTQFSYLKDPSYKGGHGMPTALIGNSFMLSTKRNMLASYFSVRVIEIVKEMKRDKDEMHSTTLYITVEFEMSQLSQ
jgi:hypothetical protein